MTTATLPTLRLAFSPDPARARLTAADGLGEDLRRLAIQFRTATHVSAVVVEVEIDDLITNLRVLASWPHTGPGTVEWDPRLSALAKDSVLDGRAVSARLASDSPTSDDVSADEVRGRLGPNWTGNLTAFQRRDVARLLSLRHGANFSVPGAGKTRVALAAFQALREQGNIRRLLIVGPKSSYDAWITESNACFGKPPTIQVLEKTVDPLAEVLIVNYERLAGSLARLSHWLDAQSAMLILDEAHRMKLGADGTYGAACLALGPHARHRLILTGTPAPNGVKDLENLFGFVWPGTGRQKVIQAVAGGDLAAASKALQPLFTRTTKRELGLPEVTTTVRRLALPPLHQEVYDALLGQFSARIVRSPDDLEQLGKIIVYMLMAATSPALLAVGSTRYEPLAYRVPPIQVPRDTELFQLLQDLPQYEFSPKYREVLAIVQANAAAGRKTLVWSTFIRSVNTLRDMLSAFSPAVVHGGTEDRELQIERFRNDPECFVLLSNPATLGEGISLHHHCHDAVYVDRDFAAGRYLQSLDRIHRLGLEPGTRTSITVLVSESTIDEVVEARLGKKLDFMGRILDDPDVQELADLDEEPSIGGGLDQNDLMALMGHLRANAA
ncbi:DEAD/DEAH box helicase [Promicromonospora sp. NPDC060271]|uniref:DEAD/DEAH box helicase n=1 Tax=Promicromonospora sp. NPDC060271 TaxID=3347089 RepID=UPI003663581E